MMDNLNIDKMDKNHEYVNLNKIWNFYVLLNFSSAPL